MTPQNKKNVETGVLVATSNVNSQMNDSKSFNRFVQHSITRHKKGDWGNVSTNDQETNNEALVNGARLISLYNVPPKKVISDESKIMIITEADRSATTVLFPYEY